MSSSLQGSHQPLLKGESPYPYSLPTTLPVSGPAQDPFDPLEPMSSVPHSWLALEAVLRLAEVGLSQTFLSLPGKSAVQGRCPRGGVSDCRHRVEPPEQNAQEQLHDPPIYGQIYKGLWLKLWAAVPKCAGQVCD